MTAIVALRYLVSSGAFALATRLRHPGLYRGRGAQMRREIGWSLASAAIYGLPAGIVAWGWQAPGWTRLYGDLDARPPWSLPFSPPPYPPTTDRFFLCPPPLPPLPQPDK